MNLKITDFGFAKECFAKETLQTPCYTPYYVGMIVIYVFFFRNNYSLACYISCVKCIAPEVLGPEKYDKSCDIWSLGAVLYEMAALSPPFTAKDRKGLYQRVVKGIYPKIPSKYTSDLSSMIGSLLQVDPKKRLSTE